MHRTPIIIALFFLLTACAGSPYRTGIEAQENRANLLKLEVMGPPYKTEVYVVEEKPLEFWLYLTERKSMNDDRLTDSNFTPLAFENGILRGWGRNYYDSTLRIKKDITIEKK